ncbi:periplasmic heavy metal sensor [Fontisubflavum oceani]|uniref:periplasmic heavy metal sensor n=1 Tax=Fontisubflavum oceani TaxID=2978973 RepID=UPI0025B3AE55|nr:periplasmic heavy metal sensor [Fontisubflavum oceani]WJY20217.1 periplasmic heavy metal sensor [Fontisubflavum oceani]
MVETPNPPSARRPAGRGLKIALVLSLVANVMIVGVIAGAVWGKIGGPSGDENGPMSLRNLGLGPMVFVLERDDRAALRARMAEDADRFRPELRGLGRSVHAFSDALRTEPFDRAAAAAALPAATRSCAGVADRGASGLVGSTGRDDARGAYRSG